MSLAIDAFSLLAVTGGLVFFIAGTAGLLRFPDSLSRLHALAMADKLGVGLVVLGLLPRADNMAQVLKLLLIWALALFASAVAGQLMAARVRQEQPRG